MDKMSGTEFYNYVLRTFKRTDKSQEVYDAITDTIMDMAERFGFEDAKVEAYTAAGITSLGDYKLDLPSDFGRLIGDVRFSDGDTSWTMTKLSKQEFNEKFPDPDGNDPITGQPTHYAIFAKQILLGPVPDRTDYVYQLDYSKFITDAIESTTVEVLFSDNARECLKFGTLSRLYETMEDFDKGARYAQKYDIEMSQFVSRETINTRAVWHMPTTNY